MGYRNEYIKTSKYQLWFLISIGQIQLIETHHLPDPSLPASITGVPGNPSGSPASTTTEDGWLASNSLKLTEVMKMDMNEMMTLSVWIHPNQ